MTTPTTIDWARLAAFIDGEGCIRVAVGNSRRRSARIAVEIVNTDIRLLVWLSETFGGKVVRATGNMKSRTREIWRWSVCNEQAVEILSRCMDFFVIKADQAQIAIKYRELIELQKGAMKLGRGKFLPVEFNTQRDDLFLALRESRYACSDRIQ